MASCARCALFALATLLCAFSPVGAAVLELSPLTRTMELLQNLAAQAESEGKQEEQLYKKFVCWGKTVISTKSTSNADAAQRIQSLQSYIADIDAGRIEFTSERVDLEKDLKEVNDAIEQATDMRKKEHEEFLAAKDDMLKATSALGQAIEVLKLATAEHQQGVFLEQRVRQGQSHGFNARVVQAADLARAAELGSHVLSKGDSLFLRRLLTGEVPEVDWKKLNRQATFKMDYKARSFKIQQILLSLNKTISDNLASAEAKEGAALKSFDALMASKSEEKSQSQDALRKMEAETGARTLNKEDAQSEVDALQMQVNNDEIFIQQTQTSLDEKTAEWKERETLRTREIAAISEAIAILHSDDSRDLFKRSLASQGYSLLQVGQRQTVSRIASLNAADQLSQSAGQAHSSRLSALAKLLSTKGGSHFMEVLSAIDTMIASLAAEGQTDLTEKEQCESDRSRQTRDAVVKSRTMDDLTDDITRLTVDIDQVKVDIKQKEEAVALTTEELNKAASLREAEYKQWLASDADDKEAALTVERATDVLRKFYSDNNLMFVQQPSSAGQAPPPPPPTWEAPYAGKTGEATGIISLLVMIKEDIEKDMHAAEVSEEKSQAEFDVFKTASLTQIENLNTDISNLASVQADKERSVAEKTEERRLLKEGLHEVLDAIAQSQPGCDYVLINYNVRVKNRHIEVDGLRKAKAILEGATFDKGPDPSRELKPGDAFLQRLHRHHDCR